MVGIQNLLTKFFTETSRAPRVEVEATTSGTSASGSLQPGETLASPRDATQPPGASNGHHNPAAQTPVEPSRTDAPKIQSTLCRAWGLEQPPVIPPAIKANKPLQVEFLTYNPDTLPEDRLLQITKQLLLTGITIATLPGTRYRHPADRQVGEYMMFVEPSGDSKIDQSAGVVILIQKQFAKPLHLKNNHTATPYYGTEATQLPASY